MVTLNNEFIIRKEKTVSYDHEILPPGWFKTNRQIRVTETDDSNGIQKARILRTEPTGTLRKRIAKYVESAEQIVCVASFLIADSYIVQTLTNAAERGIRVYLLTASETQLFKDQTYDSEFEKDRMLEHKQFLDKIAGRVLVRTGENLHSKFILIDPNTQNAKGILLTANITSDALTRNIELGIDLNQKEVKDLFRQFLIGFWKESDSELLEPGSITKIKPWSHTLNVPENTLYTLKNGNTLKERIKQQLESAKSEIIISTFGIELSHEITQKMLQQLTKGKRVKVLARPRPTTKTMEALITLADHGAEVWGHPWLHAKAVLVDTVSGWSGTVMTANIEQHGLDDGFETGLILNEEDSVKLYHILDNWCKNAPSQLLLNKKLGEIEGEIQLWVNSAFQTTTILRDYYEDLGTFTVNSFDQLDSYQPRLEMKKNQSTRYHRVTYIWKNVPPNLPADAVKDTTKGEFNIYKHKGTTYLVVNKPSQLSEAKVAASDLKAKLVTQ